MDPFTIISTIIQQRRFQMVKKVFACKISVSLCRCILQWLGDIFWLIHPNSIISPLEVNFHNFRRKWPSKPYKITTTINVEKGGSIGSQIYYGPWDGLFQWDFKNAKINLHSTSKRIGNLWEFKCNLGASKMFLLTTKFFLKSKISSYFLLLLGNLTY